MAGTETVKVKAKKRGGWFQKIPPRLLLSPGGMVLVFFASITEILDLIPAFFIVEIILEIVLIVLMKIIIKDFSWKALIIPFGIERLDFLGIIPTWALKMLF